MQGGRAPRRVDAHLCQWKARDCGSACLLLTVCYCQINACSLGVHYYQLLTIYVVFRWIYDGCHPHQGEMITDVSCCQMNACRVCILTDIYCLLSK